MSNEMQTIMCNECQDVKFLIQQDGRDVSFICNTCGSAIKKKATLSKYRRIEKGCRCNDLTYKVSREYTGRFTNVRCAECQEHAEFVAIDDRGNVVDEEHRKYILNLLTCEKCESVGFKVKQGNEGVDAICNKCGDTMRRLSENDEYVTLKNVCNCGCDEFEIVVD